jgi:branched-chain amino acid transport system substrate-binding protein
VVQWQQGEMEVVWPLEVKSADYTYPVPNWRSR